MEPKKAIGLHIEFKDGIKCIGMEQYRDITVVYLSQMISEVAGEKFVYHIIINSELNTGVADNPDALRTLAHKDIDDYLDSATDNEKTDGENKEQV